MIDQAPFNTPQPMGTPQPSCDAQTGDKKECPDLPEPQNAPALPSSKQHHQLCVCTAMPDDPPKDCFDDLIQSQSKLATQAENAIAMVEELTTRQGKVASAQADYTQANYMNLKKRWEEQDTLIAALTEKVNCSVQCWECLLDCHLCPELTTIRALEEQLNGTGELTAQVFSLLDLQFWHQRNVTQMHTRVERIRRVLTAWEKPFDTLQDVLDKNGTLVADLPAVLATDPAKAIYDIFMTLVPRHMAIKPRGARSAIKENFIKICKSDAGKPDICCEVDVGEVSKREDLLERVPYIVDPVELPKIIYCLTSKRLVPASDQLAVAQAALAATTKQIEQTQKRIDDKTAAIEAVFKEALGNLIECSHYKKKESSPTAPTTPTTPGGGYQGDTKQSDQTIT